jgi:hypothetical protein
VPTASYLCRCGATRQASGGRAVASLVQEWTDHQAACAARPERPCQHCGRPTRALSSGMSGWPACPDCYQEWADRQVEQRRCRHQADRIAAREAQRATARRLREQMERDGYAPDVITAILAGEWGGEA